VTPAQGMLKSRRLRTLAALAISWVPLGALRRLLWTVLLGYRIGRNTRIAFGVVLDIKTCSIADDVVISRWNTFRGPIDVSIGAGAFIGTRNQITCGWSTSETWAEGRAYRRAFTMAAAALINQEHIFDVVGSISIGEGTWIAGFRSQFMTHGAGVMDRDIAIGRACFFGSAVLVTPGSTVADNTLVAMGALVTRKFAEPGIIIGGVPAKPIGRREDGDYHFRKEWA